MPFIEIESLSTSCDSMNFNRVKEKKKFLVERSFRLERGKDPIYHKIANFKLNLSSKKYFKA